MKRCLYCYNWLKDEHLNFHPACSKKLFGKPMPPQLPYSEDQMLALAGKVIKSQKAVTGVQPKLSLEIERLTKADIPQRFTIVGLWGGYILKPPTEQYPYLPEVEDVTMHLAQLSGIETVPHSLLPLMNGKLAYITKRVDRDNSKKIPMEDMCQLTEKLTEQKYSGSYEQIGKAILKYSANPILDIVNFFEQVLFSFLTGNADMHLKNFSLIQQNNGAYVLSPAYDMVATALVVKGDEEDLALSLNGKKKKIIRGDFDEALHLFDINPKTRENLFRKFARAEQVWKDLIEKSFLPDELRNNYISLIGNRIKRLDIAL